MEYKIEFLESKLDINDRCDVESLDMGFHQRNKKLIFIAISNMMIISKHQFDELFTQVVTHEYIHKILWDFGIEKESYKLDNVDIWESSKGRLKLTISGYQYGG